MFRFVCRSLTANSMADHQGFSLVGHAAGVSQALSPRQLLRKEGNAPRENLQRVFWKPQRVDLGTKRWAGTAEENLLKVPRMQQQQRKAVSNAEDSPVDFGLQLGWPYSH